MVDSVKGYFAKPKTETTAVQTPQKQAAVQPKAASKKVSANTLAQVGSWSISAEEFRDRLNALKEVVPDFDTKDLESKKLVLEELIRQQLLVEEAERNGLAGEKDIIAAVEEFRRTLIVREVARKLTEKIKVSDADAKKFYEENKADLIEPPEFKVSEIIMKEKEKANLVLVELLKGGDFAEAAKKNSIGKSKAKGGDLGFLKEEPFPQFVTTLLSMEQGDVSSVFKGPEGFYIIKLTEKKGGKQIPFKDIKEEIIQNRTLNQQQELILEHIEKLRQATNVNINEALLN